MRVIFFALLSIVLLGSSFAFAVNPPECSRLKNGMGVCVLKDTRSNMVFHSVMYKVGAVDDFNGKSGLAHFLEHMMFKGTKKYKNFVEAMADIGAAYNAMTGSEMTIYYEIAKLSDLSALMEIEADRMQGLVFSAREIEKERNVVQEERLMRVENVPLSLLYEEMASVFYRTSYSRPAIGWMTDIKTFGLAETKDFYKLYYRPENAVLFVIGDIGMTDVMRYAEATYGQLKGRGVVNRAVQVEPIQPSESVLYLKNPNVAEDSVSIWYRAPNISTGVDEYRIMHVFANLLADGQFGALYNHLVVSKKMAKNLVVSYDGLTLAQGVLSIRVTPADGVPIESIVKEVDSFVKSLASSVTLSDMQSAYKSYAADALFELGDMNNMGVFYATHISIGVEHDVFSLYSNFSLKDESVVRNLLQSVFNSKKVVGYLLKEVADASKK